MADFKYVPVFLDWLETTEALNHEEKGQLIDAMIMYARGESPAQLINGKVSVIFPIFRMQIERQKEFMNEKSMAARYAARMRWHANASECNHNKENNDNQNKENKKEGIPPHDDRGRIAGASGQLTDETVL